MAAGPRRARGHPPDVAPRTVGAADPWYAASVKITLAIVGRLKEAYLKAAEDEYVKRLRPYCTLAVVEYKTVEMEKDNFFEANKIGEERRLPQESKCALI